jgi:hypothetical protein
MTKFQVSRRKALVKQLNIVDGNFEPTACILITEDTEGHICWSNVDRIKREFALSPGPEGQR